MVLETVVKDEQHVQQKFIQVIIVVTLDFVFDHTQVHGRFNDIIVVGILKCVCVCACVDYC